MAIFKCKMCGGALEINNESVAMCEYCGTQQTLPKLNDDRKANLYDRANHFRRNNEFDKAMGIYEQILNEDPADAETYWSLVLCRYGIEYVEDPTSRKRVPTVNRAQFTSVFDDDNYKSALQYADSIQKSIYEAEAKAINEIQKGILEISQKEEPFDVFICYKETDNNGRRTPDSVLATELYHELIKEGFKVFFSRITLEDKLGTAYEPYIFAALNSAKVMVVLGTKQEYFNAVWVKNEWSRYLALIKQGQKKMLIPAYKDMDPYDLPEEFSHLQAQDMSKLGFMQDLIRGIKKIIDAQAPKATVVKETIIAGGNANTNTAPLLKRVFMFLEDGDWNSANEYCEKVLDIEPENASAYLGKLLSELRVRNQESLKDQADPFDNSNNYKKTVRFADENLKTELIGYIEYIKNRNEAARLYDVYTLAKNKMSSANSRNAYIKAAQMFETISEYLDSAELVKDCYEKAEAARLERIYTLAKNTMSEANTENDYKGAAQLFESVSEYQNSATLAKNCYEKAEETRKNAIYSNAKSKMDYLLEDYYNEAIDLFKSIPGWKDSDELVRKCEETLVEIKEKAEAGRIERERKLELARIAAEKRKKQIIKIAKIAIPVLAAIIAFIIILVSVIIPAANYSKGNRLAKKGDYNQAIAVFEELGDYKDSKDKITETKYEKALDLAKKGNYDQAIAVFTELGDYKDAIDKIPETTYLEAVALVEKGDNVNAAICYGILGDYKDAREKSFALWGEITIRETIAAGFRHTVGLKSDGTVVAVGWNEYGQCDVSGWTDIVAVSAGDNHTVGLKSDGTVVAVGNNRYGQCDVGGWEDIVAVSAGYSDTVGLKRDGTVVAVGSNYYGDCDVGGWTDIVAVLADSSHTVGLKSDGTVVAVGLSDYGQCDVSDWTDIKLPE